MTSTFGKKQMAIFKWLERKLFTGEVLKDYGAIVESKSGVGTMRQTLLLCRTNKTLELVIRSSAKAPFGASVSYVKLPATADLLETLQVALDDAKAQHARDENAEQGESLKP